MGYLFLVDSFSELNDSINASYWAEKINPYYLLYLTDNSSTLDTFLGKYHLTKKVVEICSTNYSLAYKSTKSVAYNTFREMASEDQKIRNTLYKCDDSASLVVLNKKMQKIDSTHSGYLYNYVKLNGWPGLENGSMYASLLAIHDHNNHEFYIPHLKKAVLNGQVERSAYNLVLHWTSKTMRNFKNDKKNLKNFNYDVSSLLDNTMPATLNRIEKKIKALCPTTKFYIKFAFEAPTSDEFWNWFNSHPNNKKHIFNQFIEQISKSCPKQIPLMIWHSYYVPSNTTNLRVYIFY